MRFDKYVEFFLSLVITLGIVFLIIVFISVAYCQACERSLDNVQPELKEKITLLKTRALYEYGTELIVICGYRSQDEQDRLYAQGRTEPGRKVTWTRSSNHTKGFAVDLAIRKENGTIDWSPESYYEIGRIGKSLGLVWGGDWKVGDFGHFELSERLAKK